jgi:exosome complex component RRP40
MEEEIVFPGDIIRLEDDEKVVVDSSVGIQPLSEDSVAAIKFGVKKHVPYLVIDNVHQRTYFPAVDDLVLGTVVDKGADTYGVDIGVESGKASLPTLAFEGGSRRNRPNIPVGALVYARVEVAAKNVETELSCKTPFLNKDWVTKETVFGQLKGGYSFPCSLGLSRELLTEDCVVLHLLSEEFRYEIAVGVNGRVWVHAESMEETIFLVNAIKNSEGESAEAIKHMLHEKMTVPKKHHRSR